MSEELDMTGGEAAGAGLCAMCEHCKRIRTPRGSTFFQCRLAFENSRYTRYPVLPVLSCAGFHASANRAD